MKNSAGSAKERPSKGSVLLGFLLFSLSVASGQNTSLAPHLGRITLTAGFRPDPYVTSVSPGGSVNLRNSRLVSGLGATGFVSEAPDLGVTYNPVIGILPLTFSVQGGGQDTVLLVNGPDRRWYFNDDTNGKDPQIRINNPKEGRYDVWVGTYRDGGIGRSVTLSISELVSTSTASSGGHSLTAGFRPDPFTLTIRPGGSVNLETSPQARGLGAVGYVASSPDAVITYDPVLGILPLIFSVQGGNQDTTLFIKAPNGAYYFNDDSDGLDPKISFDRPSAGRYEVWVGTFDNTGVGPAVTLAITEMR